MTESKLLVKTTLGTTILDLEKRIDVHFKDDIYVIKEAIDLNPGDLVSFGNEYIETTLDEAEDYLDLSQRYMHAKKRVSEQNVKGEFIPLLRTELWRGILKKQDRYNESLESIITKATDDFTKLEYNEAISNISALLSNKNIEISETAVRNWLEGETFAPREWQIFNALSEINPLFKEFDGNYLGFDGRYYNYKFFVVARQTVMRHLARMKGEEFKIKKEKEADSIYKMQFDEEIENVVAGLMQYKNSEYSLTRVVETQILPPKHEKTKATKRDPQHRLHKGIIPNVPEVNVRRKNVEEFFREYALVNSLFSCIIDNYMELRHKEQSEEFLAKDEEGNILKDEQGRVWGYHEAVKQFMLHKYNEPEAYKSDYSYKRLETYFSPEKFERLERLSEDIINEAFNGTMDDSFVLPKGSMKKLFETNYRIKMLRPKTLLDYEKITDLHKDNLEAMNAIEKKQYKTEKDEESLKKLYYECEPIHEKIMRMQKRMSEKFPVTFAEEYHGVMHITLVNNKSKANEGDIERTISTYSLNEFRELFKLRFAQIYDR
jgi:hypothetical protein